ncbi:MULTISPECIES: hypothetical protein [unclassified Anoxybacillus]|uniref:hypothetical protein n=1 Tax=unclassified Anoxybacillus TaxID=2639704 RepID=UPI000AA7FDF9|nr:MULTISPECIES: hypothetical protein [unclassified Anoxybacillus]
MKKQRTSAYSFLFTGLVSKDGAPLSFLLTLKTDDGSCLQTLKDGVHANKRSNGSRMLHLLHMRV